MLWSLNTLQPAECSLVTDNNYYNIQNLHLQWQKSTPCPQTHYLVWGPWFKKKVAWIQGLQCSFEIHWVFVCCPINCALNRNSIFSCFRMTSKLHVRMVITHLSPSTINKNNIQNTFLENMPHTHTEGSYISTDSSAPLHWK